MLAALHGRGFNDWRSRLFLITVTAVAMAGCKRSAIPASPIPPTHTVRNVGDAPSTLSAQYELIGGDPIDIWRATPPYDYQYDNSIIYTGRPDGLYYMYSCGTGDGNMGVPYDRIKLMRSNDGIHWTAPVIALEPTPGGLDEVAACNPSVFADASTGYWYMLYTAATAHYPTDHEDRNAIFAARATDPNGPWQKWDGSGWGGQPAWVIPPDPNAEGCADQYRVGCYGIGEPSVIHTWEGVYVYFTQWNHAGLYEALWVFHDGANWPGQLAWGHLVATKFYDVNNGYHEGPWDVKLVIDNGLNKFMAVASLPYTDMPKVMISDDYGENFYQYNPYVDTSQLHQHSVGCQNTSIVGGPSGEYSDWYHPFIVCSEGPAEADCGRPPCAVDHLYMQHVHLGW